jgi:hypothetical protein
MPYVSYSMFVGEQEYRIAADAAKRMVVQKTPGCSGVEAALLPLPRRLAYVADSFHNAQVACQLDPKGHGPADPDACLRLAYYAIRRQNLLYDDLDAYYQVLRQIPDCDREPEGHPILASYLTPMSNWYAQVKACGGLPSCRTPSDWRPPPNPYFVPELSLLLPLRSRCPEPTSCFMGEWRAAETACNLLMAIKGGKLRKKIDAAWTRVGGLTGVLLRHNSIDTLSYQAPCPPPDANDPYGCPDKKDGANGAVHLLEGAISSRDELAAAYAADCSAPAPQVKPSTATSSGATKREDQFQEREPLPDD